MQLAKNSIIYRQERIENDECSFQYVRKALATV